MNTKLTKTLLRSALVVALLGLLAGTAAAQVCSTTGGVTTCNLRAVALSAQSGAPNYLGETVPMWGFVPDSGNCDVPAGAPWGPGPLLEVDLAAPSTDLTINLRNCLAGEPVSIVIPALGLPTGSTPSTTVDADGRTRVTSFTNEAVATNDVVTYSWTGIEPGTYLYQSGSNPGEQVQMGLYGALVVDQNRTAGIAYPGVEYDIDAIILYSEVDPALHAPPTRATPLGFKPKYFLVNGRADGLMSMAGLLVNQQVLLRFVNAGFNTYIPNLVGEYMEWVAEDGRDYSYAKNSYSGLLAAGKTLDALWTPVTAGTHKLYDRRLFQSRNGVVGGGLVATLTVGTAAGTPTAVIDVNGDETHLALGTVVSVDGRASRDASGQGSTNWQNLIYTWGFASKPPGSFASLSPGSGQGAYDQTFVIDKVGTYVVSLQVTDANNLTSPVDTIAVSTNRRPVAFITAPATAATGSPVMLMGSGTDPDGDAIASYAWTLTGPATSGATLSSTTAQNPTFTPDVDGAYTAELVVNDGELDSVPPATAVISAAAATNQAPVANPDYATAEWCHNVANFPADCPATSTVTIPVLANDTDDDGIADAIDPSSVDIITFPTQGGSVAVNPDGTVTYTVPYNWRGTDAFVYVVSDTPGGLVSNPATVLVNVVNHVP